MNYFDAVLLSIVEGLTEFLPISSTGHLILFSNLLSIPESNFLKSFEIIIQLGAILAVFFLYGNLLWKHKMLWPKIFTAFIPAGIVGFVLYKGIRSYLLGNELITVLALFVGGILLILMEVTLTRSENKKSNLLQITYKNSFLIGMIQSISIIPGVSRAAATIIGGRLLGLNRESAVIFSFLLAIPTIFAASIYDLSKNRMSFNNQELTSLAIGFIGSFIVAIFAIKFFIKFVQKHSFISFGLYRIIIAIIYWFYFLR